MSILKGFAAFSTLAPILKRFGGPVVGAMVNGGKVKDVVEAVADQLGTDAPTATIVEKMRELDPEALAGVLKVVEENNAARWAVELANARSGSFFVKAARPASKWALVAVIVYAGIVSPLLVWVSGMAGVIPPPETPPIVWDTLMVLLPLLYGTRAIEGIAGTKSSSL